MTPTRTRLAIASAAMTAALFFGLSARAQQGVAGRVGEALDNTGRAIKGGVQRATTRAQNRTHSLEMAERVYGRIHWEKSLATAALEVETLPSGVTTLRGVVPDAKAKVKAVELARDTVGVTQVVDELSVGTVDPATPAPVVEAPKVKPVN